MCMENFQKSDTKEENEELKVWSRRATPFLLGSPPFFFFYHVHMLVS